MRNNPSETKLNHQETPSRGKLEEGLRLAEEKREQISARAPEFYDKEMYDLYVSSATRFGAGSDRQIFYINTSGVKYKEALENYKKFEAFQNEQLGPINRDIHTIAGEITKIKNKEAAAREKQLQLESEKKFQTEKKELEDALYQELDAIHAKIPQEAHDVGMSTEIALETYLPELVGRAQRIEVYIERVENAVIPYDLSYIKKDLEGSDIFKK